MSVALIFACTCFDCREYIDKNIVDFARKNPGIAIYVREQNGKHPTIIANFSKFFCGKICSVYWCFYQTKSNSWSRARLGVVWTVCPLLQLHFEVTIAGSLRNDNYDPSRHGELFLLIINSILQMPMAIFNAVESWNRLPVIRQFYFKENIIEVRK